VADFCTVDDVEELLQIEISDADKIDSCERAIEEATAAIKNYCHQTIEEVEDDEYTFDIEISRRKKLFLPELPVTSVASVVEDGTALTEGDDEDYQLGNDGVLHRIDDYWARGVQIVSVTYTHGYATIPDDVVGVCTRAAARAYQAGLRSSESDAVPGVESKSIGDFSVSYSSGAGGVGEGVMGVSGSRMLLLSEKDILNKYRYRGP
jgi:hypothetical protein